MNKKRLLPFLIFVTAFSTIFVAQISAASLSNYPSVVQEKSNWCWAATGSSILKYYGLSVSQCNFYKEAKVNSSCSANETGTITEVMRGLSSYNVGSSLYSGAYSFSGAKYQIDDSKPLWVRWRWSSGTGHAVVIYGYYTAMSTNYVYYMDPASGTKTSMAYSSFVGGGNYKQTWTHTLYNVY
ncbi:Papain-like cysteine protease AvrRpt2 [Evansella caseinilytica]|uniref:Papain-like cysteine protease AvrRpt2 n=1 Tax=Evansella caseinilytica TaxID=1503961 RepID=A0A1H3PRT3_9BACI|nr:papain-like cysteine protease family protein [Evansella caseinilytica]SDZ03643.1 Papain-like cysteine protease AvrRpt2 [Evansella caseinilytica]